MRAASPNASLPPDQSAGRASAGRASAAEMLVVGLALLMLVIVQLLAANSAELLWHPLWLDECLTQLLANDPSFAHAMRAIHGGVETNPPTLYLVLWPIAKIAGGLGPIGLRASSLIWTILALVGIYAINRRFFDRSTSLLGTLVLAAHPLVLTQMFEARFYGLWLAGAAWFCYALLVDSPLWLRILLAILLATVHWFGIVSLVLIGGTDLLMSFRAYSARRSTPIVAGVIATLASLPFLFGQRAGLSVKTWLDPIDLAVISRVLPKLFEVNSIFVIVLAWWGWRVFWRDDDDARSEKHVDLRRLAPLSSLLAFPLLLAAGSYVLQPMLVERYAIVATAALAPLGALLASRMQSPVRWLLIGVLCVVGVVELHANRSQALVGDARTYVSAKTIEDAQTTGAHSFVFRQRIDQYPVVAARPDLAAATSVLVFDDVADSPLSDRSRYERDMARRVNRFYPQFQIVELDALRHVKSFMIFSPAGEEDELTRILPGFHLVPRGPNLYEATPP